MSAIDVSFPGNVAQVDTVADLRALTTSFIANDALYGVVASGFYTYDAGSLATDDGLTILKPDDRTALQAGRWLISGNALVEYKAGFTGSVARPYSEVFGETISAGDAGLVQSVGPTNGQTVALQKALDAAASYSSGLGKAAFIPQGLFYLNATLTPKDYSRAYGDGPRASVLYNEQHPLADEAFRATGATFGFSRFDNFGIRGFDTAFRFDGNTDGLRFKSLHLLNCGIGFDFAGYFQTSVFEDIEIASGGIGIKSQTAIANRVTLRDIDFKDLTDKHLYFQGAEDVLVEGARHEGGGVVGKATLDLTGVRLIQYVGGYFENTHEYLASTAGMSGQLGFSGTHFTGTGINVGNAYEWLTDGTGTFVFHNCHATYPMRVPANSIMEGSNAGLIPSIFGGRGYAKGRRPGANEFALVRFTRTNTSSDASNYTDLTGYITLDVETLAADGTTYGAIRRQIKVKVTGRGSALTVTAATVQNDDEGVGTGATYTTAGDGATKLLNINASSINAGTALVFRASWTMTWSQNSHLDYNLFAVELQ